MAKTPLRAADIPVMRYRCASLINAEKCIAYLRKIGVEVDDKMGDGWLDTERVDRFLKRMKSPSLIVERWTCKCGEMEGFRLRGSKAPRPKPSVNENPRKPATCEECGSRFCVMHTWYKVARDGTETDYRPEMERFSPFDWKELIAEHRSRHAEGEGNG